MAPSDEYGAPFTDAPATDAPATGPDDVFTRTPWPGGFDPRLRAQIERNFFEPGGTIRFDRVVKIQPWARLWWTDKDHALFIATRVALLAKAVDRKLTQTEIDAASEINAYGARTSAYATPSAVAVAAAAAYKGRHTFRFPLYTPKPTSFNPNVFGLGPVVLFTGARAPLAWHCLRAASYLPLAWISSKWFFTSLTVGIVGSRVSLDPRLGSLKEDLVRRYTNVRAAGKRKPADGAAAAGWPGDTPDADPSAPSSETDDAMDDQGVQNALDASGAGSSPATATQRQGRWRRGPHPGQGQVRPSKSETSSFDDDDTGLLDDGDDASSPTAPAASSGRQQQRGLSPPRASVWDRLRQQTKTPDDGTDAMSGHQDSAWARSRQVASSRPSSSTRKEDDTSAEGGIREKARSQAQKEFDDMLEAERRGGEADKGWSRKK